jgi:hypothetical protein
MDLNRIELINIVEQAALQLQSQDAAKIAAKGPKVYDSYNAARANAGWHSDCLRSPLPGLLRRDMPLDQAEAEGYTRTRRTDLTSYVLVATSYDAGYVGRASKTYYSIWGR